MITYKQVLNRGLVKEAAPRWVKVINTLANTGKISQANNILRRIGSTIKYEPWASNVLNVRAESILKRFLNRKSIPRYKRVLAAWNSDKLFKRLIDQNRPGTKRFLNWYDNAFTHKALDLINKAKSTGNIKLYEKLSQRFAPLIYKYDRRISKYPTGLSYRSGGITPQVLKRIEGTELSPLIDRKAPPIILKEQDYLFAGKNPRHFAQNLKAGVNQYMSGILQVGERYKAGISGSHDPRSTAVIGLMRKGLTRNGQPITLTPHLAENNQNIRRAYMQGLDVAKIWHPDLQLNQNPNYQAIISLMGSNPQVFRRAIINPVRLPSGLIQAQPLDLFHEVKPNKLQVLFQKGILHRPSF